MITIANRDLEQHPFKMRRRERLRQWIDVSRIHITVIASMGLFTFGWLFTGIYPWLLTIVCALDWYIVNLANKIADFKEDKVNP